MSVLLVDTNTRSRLGLKPKPWLTQHDKIFKLKTNLPQNGAFSRCGAPAEKCIPYNYNISKKISQAFFYLKSKKFGSQNRAERRPPGSGSLRLCSSSSDLSSIFFTKAAAVKKKKKNNISPFIIPHLADLVQKFSQNNFLFLVQKTIDVIKNIC